jgi:hypothetical protein
MTGKQPSVKEMLRQASEAESNNDFTSAKGLYRRVLAVDPLNMYAYDRLMILFRKLKKYREELKMINEGIKSYQQFYQESRTGSKKISELSRKLNRSFGLADSRGNSLYEPEPIARWKKRKTNLQKKLN